MATAFTPAWLSGDPTALSLLPDRRGARAAVAGAAARGVAPGVLAALRAQNARLPASAARDRHLELLAQPGATAVVTGQQVGLFLGPLYTVYKAAAAVVAARALGDETGRPCVPVFWLQTEDHDLPEIDHCHVLGADGRPLRLALDLPGDSRTARAPVGGVRLGPSVLAALEALEGELGAGAHLALLRRAYRPEATLAEAFAEVLAALFAEEGLVFLDPRDPALWPLAAPVHRRLIAEAGPIADGLAERAAALEAAGFAVQVHVRPGAPLSFYSPDGSGGPRYRLDPRDGGWALVGGEGSVSTAELLGWLEREPGRFTTSALARPILQDTWLPTAAYVGGPGEIAYFAQLPPLYRHFGLPAPMVVPRARFRVLDGRTRSLLGKLGLTADEALGPRDEVLARLAGEPEAVEDRLLGGIVPELQRLGADPGLARAAARTEATVRRAVGRFAARHRHLLAELDRTLVGRLDKLRARLLPEGVPQERLYALATFAGGDGGRGFVRAVIDACTPFAGDQKDLCP